MGYNKPPYYLTAYGLAVLRGFKGTLDEWLRSLHGDDVEMRYLNGKIQWRRIKGAEDLEPEDGWQDLLDMNDIREEIVGEAAKEADRAEEAAERAISGYYRATREELEVSNDEINSEYIFGLYDALAAQYPDRVQKKEVYSNDGTFTNYVYEISTGDYSTDGSYTLPFGSPRPPINKPKYLVSSGIHGKERTAIFSTYRLVCDVLKGHNIPGVFKEGAIICVMPVAVPYGFDNYTSTNENGIDIQCNFDLEGDGTPTPEKETQVIEKWLAENSDAELFIEFHNTGGINEKVIVISLPNNPVSNMARKIALRGVDHVIPLWRDVLKYHLTVESEGVNDDGTISVKDRPVIFSYSITTVETNGRTIEYAQEKLGIPALAIETARYYGSHTEMQEHLMDYQPESVAMGAEALGNILIGFYNQPSLKTTLPDVTDTASLTDIATGMKYTLYVENGELKMEVAQ